MNRRPSDAPLVEQTAALSPHAEAILKAGEQLILESVQTGREFCKALVGISFSAVPFYVALLGLVTPKDVLPNEIFGRIWVMPAALYLFAASVAVVGYLPQRRMLSIDLPHEVEEAVSSSLARRYWSSLISFAFLLSGIGSSIWIIACTEY